MNYVLIIHSVRDYTAWKKIFDAAGPMRKSAGEQSYYVLRDESDANRIVHFSRWDSLENARAFFESERLIEIRRQASVDAPEFIYLHNLEQGTL